MSTKVKKHKAHAPRRGTEPTRLDVHIGLGVWAEGDPAHRRLDVSWTSRGVHATASVPGRVVELVFIEPFCSGIEAADMIRAAIRDGAPRSLVIGNDPVALPEPGEADVAESIQLIDAGE